MRGEYIPAIGRLAIALARADGGAALRGAIRACYDDRTAWFTVALTLGPALDMLLDDAEIGPLVRAMRDGREVPSG